MTQITDQQKSQILADPILDTRSAKQAVVSLIEDIETAARHIKAEQEEGENNPLILDDEKFNFMQRPRAGSDIDKAMQAIENNGLELGLINLLNYETKKRKNQKKAYLSIVNARNIKGVDFAPESDSQERTDAYAIQSIVGVRDITLSGNFSPKRMRNTGEKQLKQSSKQASAEQKQLIINQTKQFLQVKKDLINTRKLTITKLEACCNQLERDINLGKYAKLNESGRMIGAVGNTFNSLALGIVKAVGETIAVGSDSAKRKFTVTKVAEFQNTLDNDEAKLAQFNAVYVSLVNILNKHKDLDVSQNIIKILKLENKLASDQEVQLFDLDYQVYEVLTNIWKGKQYLTSEEMRETIKMLKENFSQLKAELKEARKQLVKDLGIELDGDSMSSSLASLADLTLSEQIKIKREELTNLLNSAQEKIKSKSKFSAKKKDKERNLLLQSLLDAQEEIVHSRNTDDTKLSNLNSLLLETKLTSKEINALCQAKKELTQLQKELKSLQEQQAQIEVLSE